MKKLTLTFRNYYLELEALLHDSFGNIFTIAPSDIEDINIDAYEYEDDGILRVDYIIYQNNSEIARFTITSSEHKTEYQIIKKNIIPYLRGLLLIEKSNPNNIFR